jgi:hypothetical protein
LPVRAQTLAQRHPRWHNRHAWNVIVGDHVLAPTRVGASMFALFVFVILEPRLKTI